MTELIRSYASIVEVRRETRRTIHVLFDAPVVYLDAYHQEAITGFVYYDTNDRPIQPIVDASRIVPVAYRLSKNGKPWKRLRASGLAYAAVFGWCQQNPDWWKENT